MPPMYLNVEQNSDAWIAARLGIPTASEFKRIITPGGKLSSQRDRYRAELIAEYVTKEPFFQFESEAMARGKVLEPEAFRVYQLMRDIEPLKVGFVYRDETLMAGCSPDGLIGDAGLLELKVPEIKTHLVWLDEGELPAEHYCQIQGQIWCAQREWCDFMSYAPGYPQFLTRVLPDPLYQRALTMHMPAFISEVVSSRQRMVTLGVPVTEAYIPRPRVGEAPDLVPGRYNTDYARV